MAAKDKRTLFIVLGAGLGVLFLVCVCAGIVGAMNDTAKPGKRSDPAQPAATTSAPAPTTPAATTAAATTPPAVTVVESVAPPPPVIPQTTEAPAPQPTENDVPDVYYKNCTEARAAGAAPLYRGEPGYRKALDRDGDGVACE